MADVTYQTFCNKANSSRVPKRSLSQVKSSRLQIATDVDGMTSRLVWNYYEMIISEAWST